MTAREATKTTAAHRVGPFDVTTGSAELTLRLENRGELNGKGCLLFGFTMLIVLSLGILAMVQSAESIPHPHSGMDNPARLLAPRENHFGFLWLFSSIVMLIVVPIYVSRTYKSALVFTFRRADDAFLRDNRLVARLRKIDYLSICEGRDPDARYLYLLNIVYNDGQQMLLHNGYDEREIMNLANEVAAFVGTRVLWKDIPIRT